MIKKCNQIYLEKHIFLDKGKKTKGTIIDHLPYVVNYAGCFPYFIPFNPHTIYWDGFYHPFFSKEETEGQSDLTKAFL